MSNTCPKCDWVVDYGCRCPDGPTYPLVPGPAFIPEPSPRLPWPYESRAQWAAENVPDGGIYMRKARLHLLIPHCLDCLVKGKTTVQDISIAGTESGGGPL